MPQKIVRLATAIAAFARVGRLSKMAASLQARLPHTPVPFLEQQDCVARRDRFPVVGAVHSATRGVWLVTCSCDAQTREPIWRNRSGFTQRCDYRHGAR